jgi:uncharacterized protein (DUF1919 family)
MIKSIISNNCSGSEIAHSLNREFKSPTINLQILPEEYPMFCDHLGFYMNQPLEEYKDIQDHHKAYLTKMFGCIPDMPFGLLYDVIVCFQHYGTFEEAKAKWNERKERIDYGNLGYLFHARGREYEEEARKFICLGLPNSLVLTENFSVDGSNAFYPGEGLSAFSGVDGKLLITTVYDFKGWIDNDQT